MESKGGIHASLVETKKWPKKSSSRARSIVQNRFERGEWKRKEILSFFFFLSLYDTRMHASSVEKGRIQKRPCRVSLEKRVWTYLPLSTLGPIDDPATPRAISPRTVYASVLSGSRRPPPITRMTSREDPPREGSD